MTRGSWWRRNRWGLLVLLPMLAFALAIPAHDAFATYHDAAPRDPVNAGTGGWVAFSGATMRLDSLARDPKPKDSLGEPITVPAGITFWHARIELRATRWTSVAGCQLRLEDAAGNTYDEHPDEMSDLGIFTASASCSPDTDGSPPAVWKTYAYFITPTGAQAVAVRVILFTATPRYARLSLA